MKFLAVFITVLLAMVSVVNAADVNLQWDPNAEPDLAGYRLYQANESMKYTTTPIRTIPAGTETLTINVPEGFYYWVITAFDEKGNESAYSNEVSLGVDETPPAAPTMTVVVQVKVQLN